MSVEIGSPATPNRGTNITVIIKLVRLVNIVDLTKGFLPEPRT